MSNKELQYITFKQFFYTINIRNCYGDDIENNQIIRLINNNENEDNYIEIGWYDYFNKDSSWKILEKTLNKNILDSIVTDIRYEEKYNCIFVYWANRSNMNETLEEYTN